MEVMTARKPLLPWLVWGVAVLAYAIAVVNRSSLAALGPVTQEHFGIEATTLSMFAMIQLIVYAGLQIPVGVLLDRFGSRAMILGGAGLMIAGQALMALAPNVGLAIFARVLVGAGDACTFISVMAILPHWFALKQLPIISQLTGLIGQIGQLAAVAPLAAVEGAVGWTSTFLGVAAVGLLVAILGAAVLREKPGDRTVLERMTGRTGRASREARSLAGAPTTSVTAMAPPATELIPVVDGPRLPGRSFWARLRRVLSIPGVRLAYWIHFTTPFAGNVFILLWGTPFLEGGVGLSESTSRALLSLTVVSSMIASVVLGPLLSRYLERRVYIAVGITLAIVVVWLLVLCWPGTPPVWLLVLLLVVMPIGNPASMIGFEVSRSHSPRSFAGFSTGVVNTAGFTSSLLLILIIGLLLDLQGAGSPETYSLTAFRVAFAAQIPFWALGIVCILVEQRRTARWMDEHGRRLR